jgi:hypothetical protein
LQLLTEVQRRNPDGVLFDYVRFPRGRGTASVVSKVHDLFIHSEAARQAFLDRASNPRGRFLLQQFLDKGFVGSYDIAVANNQYPNDQVPLWENSKLKEVELTTPDKVQAEVQQELWALSVAHAQRGILEFLQTVTAPIQAQGYPAGAVFFPDGYKAVGQGFDSRLQPWPFFAATLEWHPMAYRTCGNADCIVQDILTVLEASPQGTLVQPALAGMWGQATAARPSLETQMEALRRQAPQINAVSHFSYGWQRPEATRERKFCQL